MASFIASPTCPLATLPRVCLPRSQQTSYSVNGGPSFSGLKRVPKIEFLKAATIFSTRSKSSKTTISCSAAPETLEIVQTTIANQLSIEVSTVTPATKFADLGADSLDTVEIMMALEEQFEVSIGEGGAENIVTVQDAADLIQKVQAASA
ncbi:uncharacterized protein LOC126669447 [Mercurialis annua]|uniref:uncharacterized protein LOC126669447 n=1 Tax=Mercurialis annua TaxID=3986 RepID=UPI00215DEF4A|nr:uncharacterized protein LOC126669447 [Mercurialis annua]